MGAQTLSDVVALLIAPYMVQRMRRSCAYKVCTARRSSSVTWPWAVGTATVLMLA